MADILGGILRGLSNNKASLALQQSNVKGPNNPLTTQWIGVSQDTRQMPAGALDSTQGMAIPWGKGSPGTQLGFAQLVPLGTDIPVNLAETNVEETLGVASQLGSLVQRVPDGANIGNIQNGATEIMPQNAMHWARYFANQIGNKSLVEGTNPASVLTAISNQANAVADGVPGVWHGYHQVLNAMNKSYTPSNTFFGGGGFVSNPSQIPQSNAYQSMQVNG